jgi:hypothetical protein
MTDNKSKEQPGRAQEPATEDTGILPPDHWRAHVRSRVAVPKTLRVLMICRTTTTATTTMTKTQRLAKAMLAQPPLLPPLFSDTEPFTAEHFTAREVMHSTGSWDPFLLSWPLVTEYLQGV